MSYGGLFLADPHASFYVVWSAQVIGSFGQPLILNNVARLAGDWFPLSERDMAVTVSVVARSLGVMAISAATPFIVRQPSQIPLLYVWQARAAAPPGAPPCRHRQRAACARGAEAPLPPPAAAQVPIWAALVVAGFVLIRDRPDVGPPSSAAATQWESQRASREEDLRSGRNPNRAAVDAIWEDSCALWGNRNFMYLALSFSLLTGLGWTFLTIVGQLIEPCGFSNETAGLADAVFMGFNALGCFAAVPLVEQTRAYLELQQSFSWLTAASALGVFASARPGGMWAVLAAWAASGFFMGPLTPLSVEHAAEMTYPIAANSSTTVLNILANLVGFVETVLLTPLLQLTRSADCQTPITWAAGFTLACVAVGLVFTQLMWRDYRRQKAEAAAAMGNVEGGGFGPGFQSSSRGGGGGDAAGAGGGLPAGAGGGDLAAAAGSPDSRTPLVGGGGGVQNDLTIAPPLS